MKKILAIILILSILIISSCKPKEIEEKEIIEEEIIQGADQSIIDSLKESTQEINITPRDISMTPDAEEIIYIAIKNNADSAQTFAVKPQTCMAFQGTNTSLFEEKEVEIAPTEVKVVLFKLKPDPTMSGMYFCPFEISSEFYGGFLDMQIEIIEE